MRSYSLFAKSGHGAQIDLRVTRQLLNYKGKDLHGLKFRNADLSGADMSDADLSGCDFTEANLSYTDLRGTKLDNANLTNTHFFPKIVLQPKTEIRACLTWYYQTYALDKNLAILKPLIMHDLLELLHEFMEYSPDPHDENIKFVRALLQHPFLKLSEPHSVWSNLLARVIGFIGGAESESNFTLSQRELANIIPRL